MKEKNSFKFRAWDKRSQVMRDVEALNFYEGTYSWIIDDYVNIEQEWVDANLDNVILMQSTGLKDKYGVEIFEGDVVKITNTERFCGENYTCYSEVKKIDGHIYVWPHPVVDGEIKRFGAKLLFSGMAKYIKDKGVGTEDVEVLGNIYENSELLEVTE